MPIREVNGKFLVLNHSGAEVGYAFSRGKAEQIHAKKVGGAPKAAPRAAPARPTPTGRKAPKKPVDTFWAPAPAPAPALAPSVGKDKRLANLRFTEGSSDKVWELWQDEDGYFARYGKFGAAKLQTSRIPSKAIADKRLQEKLDKGYEEIASRGKATRHPAPITLARVAAPAPKTHRGDPGPPKGVMLAKKWEGQDVSGWWESDKLDGMRAIWNGAAFYTRNGKPVAVPEWFIAQMPELPMDGELFVGPGRFQETISIVRKATPRDPRWKQIKFHVFDAPETPGPFEKRMAVLEAAARTSPVLVFVKQTRIAGVQDVAKHLAAAERRGQEGIMLRAPGSAYSRTRSSDLLKVKSFHSAEAKITGYTKGTGKHAGKLGAYEVTAVRSTGGPSAGTTFKIGTGISDAERSRPLSKGTVVTYTFQELTNAGVPRFPALVGARDYE